MQNFWRAILTVLVWLMLGGIALAAIIQSQYSNVDVNAIAIPAMVLATITTLGLWILPELVLGSKKTSGMHYISGAEGEKAKRDSGVDDPRMALLMEMMDDDELQAFKERLKQQIIDEAYVTHDGEIAYRGTSLEDLIEDQETARHR